MSKVCKVCLETSVIHDEQCGNWVCEQCGTIDDESNLSLDPFQNNAFETGTTMSSANPRVAVVSKNHSDGSIRRVEIGTVMKTGAMEIRKLGSFLRLKQPLQDQMQNLLQVYIQRNGSVGHSTIMSVGSICYITCRLHSKPITLLDIASACSLNVFKLGKNFLKIKEELDIKLDDIDPTIFLDRTISQIKEILPEGLDWFEVSNTSIKIINCSNRDWLTTGRKPFAIAVAAIVIALQVQGQKPGILRPICKQIGVSEQTVRQRLAEVKKVLLELVKEYLPWGKDVKNSTICQNLTSFFKCYEAKQKLIANMESESNSPQQEIPQQQVFPPAYAMGIGSRERRMEKLERAKKRLQRFLPKTNETVPSISVDNNNNNNNNQSRDQKDNQQMEDLDEEDLLIEKLLLDGASSSSIIDGYYFPETTEKAPTEKPDNPILSDHDIPDSELSQFIKSEKEVNEEIEKENQINSKKRKLNEIITINSEQQQDSTKKLKI